MRKWQALYLLFILPFIDADLQDIIKKECRHSSDSESFLQPGHVYKYRYHSVGNAASVGISDRSSEIEIECSVTVSSALSCLYNLELSDCKTSAGGGPEGQHQQWVQGHDLSQLAEYPVLFSLNNGKLGSLFALPQDPIYSVNIKRGIISGFSLSKSSADGKERTQRDVHGNCPRKTISTDSQHYRSSKNMNRCQFPSRPNWKLSPISLFWNVSFVQHLIRSTVDCEYDVDASQTKLEKVSCHERHALLPHSSKDTEVSVQTNIKYHLELESSKSALFKQKYQLNEMRATGIEMEYEKIQEPKSQPSDFLNKAQSILSDLVLFSQEEVQLRAIPLFQDLLSLLRQSTDLIPFIDSVTACTFIKSVPKCNKLQKHLALEYLKDAITQCNTGPCMKGFRHLVVRDQVFSRLYLDVVLISWSNIPIPNPTYIEEMLAICKHTEMKLCWLTLGTAIYKYNQEHSEIPQAVTDAVTYLLSYISDECNVEDVTFPSDYTIADKNEYLLTVIKTIGNIGDAARVSHNNVVKQLYSCAVGKETSLEISVAAIRAMYRMKPSNYIHKKLIFLMRDNTRAVGIRLAAYDILVNLFDDDELAKEIALLLKEEKSIQVKCYIASDVQMIEQEHIGSDKTDTFALKLKEHFKAEGIYLEDIRCSPVHHSRSFRESSFYDLHFLPKEIRGFGSKYDHKVIFETVSALPYSSSFNYTVQLFNRYYNLFEVGMIAKNWEEFGIWVRRQLSDSNINVGQWLITNFIEVVRKLGIKGLIPVVSNYGSEELSFVYPDQKVADNLRKVVKQFFDTHVKDKPSLELYLKLFGNELGFVTLNGIFSFLTTQYHWISNQNVAESLRKGIQYDYIRTLKLGESYHHLPTMMGLPLSWGSNAIYIISPRIKIDADGNLGERSQNIDLLYSDAYTVIDDMILEFPTVTKIGLQANTSLHASFAVDLTLHNSESKHLQEITVKAQDRKQKYLEFYRRNQEIYDDKIQDIPIDNIEMKEDDWCTGKQFNEIAGMKLCHYKSFPNLPDELKTSTFLYGKMESKYIGEKYDSDLKYFKLQIVKPPTNNKNIYELKLNYKAPGSQYSREANAEVLINHGTQEYKLGATFNDLPDFFLTASRTKIRNDDDLETGIKHHWLIQCNSNKKYEMTYNLNEQTESKPIHQGHKGHKRSAKSKEFLARIRERTLDFETPYNSYRWNSRLYNHHGVVKGEALLTYENLAEGWNWPARILPDTMWESDKKAWLHFNGEIEVDKGDSEHFHRHMVGTLNSPKRSVELVTHRMKEPNQLHLQLNATVSEKPTGNYLSFINGSYHQLETNTGGIWKREHEFNLVIPRYSWNIHAEREISDSESSSSALFTRLRMIPKNDEGKSYIGVPIESENSELEKIQVSYKGHIKHKHVENQLLPQKLRESEHFRNKDHRYPGVETVMDASVKFPNDDKEETITMKGHVLRLYEKKPETFKFFQAHRPLGAELSMTGANSLANMRREIKTVVGLDRDNNLIVHNDAIYIGNDKKTDYNLNVLWGEKEKCLYIDLKHDFLSSFYSFDSTILLECKPRTKAYNLEINTNTKSPEWDMLNSNTRQIFYLERHLEGWETMNFSHPAIKIDAEGKIGMDFEGPFYDKKYHIKSKTDILPSSEITYSSKLTSTPYMELNAEIPEDGFKNIKYRTDIARDGSGFSIVGTHVHTDKPEEVHENFAFSFKILSPFTISVKGYENLKFMAEIGEKLAPRVELLIQKIEAIRKDRNHPINQLIKSLRKTTKKQEEFYKKLFQQAKENRIEIRELLYPFIEPTVEMIRKIEKEISDAHQQTRENYESFTVAANVVRNVEYKEYARDALRQLPHEIIAAIKSYMISRENNIVKFHYTGPHPFYWQNLFQLPKTWEGTYRSPVFYLLPHLHKEILFKRRYLVSPFHKTAMIFGYSHIYTFDGKMYEFPDYPIPECTYMLAHDVRESTFSVLMSEQKLHLLFPELTVTLGRDEKIYLNNSREESGTPVETPNGKVSVTRESGIISVNTIGLKVLCDIQRAFCIFILDPLHHSGTIGLLGNADGEAFNDFTLPDGKHVETSSEMARGYEVSNRKRCRNIQDKEKPEFTKDVQSRCSGSFPHFSSACAAYLGIEDDLFTEACRWDVSQGKDVCLSPDALAGYCTVHGMKITPCSSKPSWYFKTVNSDKKLEVILVIEEYHKMFPTGLKGFESLSSAIQDEFGKNGYDNIIYSVIGYGGKGIHWNPHISTPDNIIWHSQTDILSHMEVSLKFQGTDEGNALEAIKYATTILPFDMQASRIMLLFTNHDANSHLSGLKIQYLKDLLDKYSLTLYTFADFQSIEKGKKVFGVKPNGLVLPHTKKESYVDYPETEVAKLTAETHGSIFLKKFVETNEPRAFFKTAAEQFYAKVEQEASKCRKCIWKLNHWWDIQNECSVADECQDK